MQSYFLRTQRLGFRYWSDEDLPLAMTLWGDDQVTRLIGGPFSDEAVRARLASEIEQQSIHGVQYGPIFLLEGDAFAGCCGLRPYPEGERAFELGFHLRPSFRGRGLAREAARAMIAYAFNTLSATSLFAGHHPENTSSARLLERLGFIYDRHEFYAPTGLEHPTYLLNPP
jgi:ribosomal-protein-alanine N-acetyltransferase